MKIAIEIDTKTKTVTMGPNTKTKSISEDIVNISETVSFFVYELPELFGAILGRYAKDFGLDECCMEACAYKFVTSASDAFNHKISK